MQKQPQQQQFITVSEVPVNKIPIEVGKQQKPQQVQKFKKIKKPKHEEIIYKNLNPFKEQQKLYKLYHDRQTDWSGLYDLAMAKVIQIDQFKVYKLPTPEDGTYIIKGFCSKEVVNRIGFLALNQFWKEPYRTNLNSRNELYDGNKQQSKDKPQQQKKPQLIEPSEAHFQQQIDKKGYSFNDKIRWANVGHQYDWTLRKYPQYHTPMHPAIKQLTDKANSIYNKLIGQKKQYHPQSAIVNYYGPKDYMTGHLDDAEYDQVSPIYSFSFGLSCVFLMGSMNKDVKPLAVRLDSGDLMIMAKNSRKCYHGVPRVIAGTYQAQQINQDFVKDLPKNYNSPKQVQTYYQTHRININIRQVFPEHQ